MSETISDGEIQDWLGIPDAYWTLRQMLDGPPEQHSVHAWSDVAWHVMHAYVSRAKEHHAATARITALEAVLRDIAEQTGCPIAKQWATEALARTARSAT